MEKIEVKKVKKEFDFFEFYKENKVLIYSIIFYAGGLISGAFVYKKCKCDALNALFEISNNSFIQEFINNVSFYFLIFSISVILGLCLIGFPFINLIPFAVGFHTGMKIGCYYILFGFKGFGYSILMIAPFVCLFLTVIMQSISKSYMLSKHIYNLTVKKTDTESVFDYKLYLKNLLIYSLLIVLIALVNTALTQALSTIITI